MDNHGFACVSVWHKSPPVNMIWSLMQNEAGLACASELMLALRRGIAGMLARGGASGWLWHSTLAILSKLRRITSQTLHRAYPGCDLPRRLPRAPCVPSRIVLERSALCSPTNRTMRPANAKKTIESRQANRPISPSRAVVFRPVAAELACVCKVLPCGGSSKLGGSDEGCIGVGGGEGRGGEGADGGSSGGGGVDFGDCGEGVPAEMLPGVGGILGGDGCGRTDGGGTIT